jgi:hypothetical protein
MLLREPSQDSDRHVLTSASTKYEDSMLQNTLYVFGASAAVVQPAGP